MGRPPKKLARTTKDDIIESARRHFLRKGYAGTSMSQIAADAKVAKSLIYHHFANKIEIWKAVKEKIIADSMGQDWIERDFNLDSLESFLHDFIHFRFNLYDKNPDLVSLMHWQRLEKRSETLGGLSQGIINQMEKKIKTLYEQKKVSHKVSLDVATYLIISLPVNPFLDNASFLKNISEKTAYISLIIKGLLHILCPEGCEQNLCI